VVSGCGWLASVVRRFAPLLTSGLDVAVEDVFEMRVYWPSEELVGAGAVYVVTIDFCDEELLSYRNSCI